MGSRGGGGGGVKKCIINLPGRAAWDCISVYIVHKALVYLRNTVIVIILVPLSCTYVMQTHATYALSPHAGDPVGRPSNCRVCH